MTTIPHLSQYHFDGQQFVPRNSSLRRALVLCIIAVLFLSVLIPKTAGSMIDHEPVRYQPPVEEVAQPKEDPLLPAATAYVSKHNKLLKPEDARMIASAVLEYSTQFKVDPHLSLALIKVESGFNPDAISPMGAKGLTQVIPKWHMEKIEEARGKFNVYSIFEPRLNIYVGLKALREMIDATGNLTRALLTYNGSSGDTTHQYANAVIAERKNVATELKRLMASL